ncbi:hypothetical protein KGY79_12575 [Candidatus Bipolaricaulota bacterium]|nr:hypothetical protein [Candidatus Bipolaricaulota bacterium]
MKKSLSISSLVLLLLVFFTWIPLTAHARASHYNSTVAKRIKNLLPEGAFLRDYSIISEKDKVLVLYILDYEIAKKYRPDAYITCPGQVHGQPIEGIYYLGLIENNKMVNSIKLPTKSRVETTPGKLEIVYRQLNETIHRKYNGPKPKSEKEAMEMSVVRLLNLKDLTGDGRPYEFQVEVYVSGCGHVEVLTAGYSPYRNEAIVFPIIGREPTEPYYWHDNFLPDETGTVNWEYKCGDHASTIYAHEKFEFNQTIEAFVMTEYERISCKEKYSQDN